jgi:hypothetical protein
MRPQRQFRAFAIDAISAPRAGGNQIFWRAPLPITSARASAGFLDQ